MGHVGADTRRVPSRVHLFAWGVIAVGTALLARALSDGSFAVVADAGPVLIVLAVLCVVAERVTLRLPRQRDDSRFTTGSLFAFSILILFGAVPATIAWTIASVVDDVGARRGALKVAFNVAQYTISMAAAGAVLTATSGLPDARGGGVSLDDASGLAVAAVVLFAVNHGIASIVSALATGSSIMRQVWGDEGMVVLVDCMQLAYAPIVAVIATYDLALLPLLGVPFAAIYLSGREAERRNHDALHDALTGLPNRTLFRRRLDQQLKRTDGAQSGCAVLFVDLDRFKEVNDGLGHAEGDSVLKQVAERIVTTARADALVARLAGDEFALLVPRAAQHGTAEPLARRLVAALEEPFTVGTLGVTVGASVGIATSRDGDDAEELLRRSDVAMYTAKESTTSVSLYDPAADRHGPARLELTAELRDGIAGDELVLHYQPKVSLSTGRVQGVEALVRWQHPTRGLLYPDAFIGQAESSGLLGALTTWVLEAAMRQATTWRNDGLDLPVAVNLSASTLLDVDLPATVADLFARHDAAPALLRLEITEHTLMRDPVRAAAVLETLAVAGVEVSVDDFGTGYSSLALLRRLPVRELKIDRSFVRDMHDNPNDAAIVHSTITLAKALGLRVVAEGVETAEAYRQLAQYGCDEAQGYFLRRPETPAALDPWLTQHSPAHPHTPIRTAA
jgi:diguanylate cyclase (GGDEF)-like protein